MERPSTPPVLFFSAPLLIDVAPHSMENMHWGLAGPQVRTLGRRKGKAEEKKCSRIFALLEQVIIILQVFFMIKLAVLSCRLHNS